MNMEATRKSGWPVGVREALARLIPAWKPAGKLPEPARGSESRSRRADQPQSDFRSDFERRAEDSGPKRERSGSQAARPLNILVPIDFTVASLSAVDWAWQIARRQTARFTLLHAIHLNLSPYGPADVNLLKREMSDTAAARMSRITELAREEGISADYLIQEGKPAAVIANHLKTGNVDLLVMTRRPHRGLGRWLRRRTAQNVIRAARCPVVVLQPNPGELEAAL
jgi:nucleotide-binding universal stress UspA family protein